MFDVAALLANQPLPAGRRVGHLTNAGGPGILAADACEAQRPRNAGAARTNTVRGAAIVSARRGSVGNPVDMIASATAEQYDARSAARSPIRASTPWS